MKQIQNLINSVDRYQQRHRLPGFVYAVIKKYGKDKAGYQAALLTYYGFLSLFPLLLVATTLVHGAAGGNSHLQSTLIKGITDYFPALGSQLSSSVGGLHRSGLALAAGILLTLYGTRGVADVFRNGIQKVWGVDEEEGFPLKPLKSLAMIVVGGLGFLGTSLLVGLLGGHGWLLGIVSILVNLFILFWLFSFLINISLPKHVPLKDTRLGAASAAVGLVILQAVGVALLSHQLKSLDALYSNFAIPLGLLFWIYLQAQMLYYAAEIAVVSSQKLWPRRFSD